MEEMYIKFNKAMHVYSQKRGRFRILCILFNIMYAYIIYVYFSYKFFIYL